MYDSNVHKYPIDHIEQKESQREEDAAALIYPGSYFLWGHGEEATLWFIVLILQCGVWNGQVDAGVGKWVATDAVNGADSFQMLLKPE